MSDTILIALFTAGGIVLGSAITTGGQFAQHWFAERSRRKDDEPRRVILRQMLNDSRPGYEWRNLDTLRHVIGSDAETTKRLLLEIEARASETGKDVWGLRSRNPLGSADPR